MGDDLLKIATPFDVVHTGSEAEREKLLLKLIEREEPDELVIGLPFNMDGTEGDQAKKVRGWGDSLIKQCGLVAHYVDERKTSEVANSQMAMSGLTHKQKKMRRDALAAAAILKRFLDQLP